METNPPPDTAEHRRLAEDARREKNWKRWGPYLAERQWGTVREDYSATGNCWDFFPYDHARSRAYRWGEDGLLGLTDRECRLCFALALWNGSDSHLKERLFGLSGPQGNHGEDVKECYYYLDSTPTHSYMKALYKYPQRAFPYERLIEENLNRGRDKLEFELLDTGVFADGRYFDIVAEYAKAAPDDVLIRIHVTNRGPEPARLDLLPTLWFRNTWIWGCRHEGCTLKPRIEQTGPGRVRTQHETLEPFVWAAAPGPNGAPPRLLFTENETNTQLLFGAPQYTPYVKDAFDRAIVHGEASAVSPRSAGTKVAAHYALSVEPGQTLTLRLRLCSADLEKENLFDAGFDELFAARVAEADDFYNAVLPDWLDAEHRRIGRQAYAGLLWSKQFYHYIVRDWLEGDAEMQPPPPQRKKGRNSDWPHLFNRDVISMPDKWEYPWYAAWDLAFHMIPLAHVDPDFAKAQLILFLREWYMHPNGQLPAYEWALGDVNPPVHAWVCWRIYKMCAPRGGRDRVFLRRVFHKLLINFTWWINRKDLDGRHLFAGGFLGMDNIGLFDRSSPLPAGGHLQQADGTAWMAFYCATMLSIALELAADDPTYEDVASKFFEHFVAITDAMNTLGGTGLWDERDGFYYDQIRQDGRSIPLKIRSMVGLLPLIAVEILDEDRIKSLPGFRKRMDWFLEYRKDLARHIAYMELDQPHPDSQAHASRLLAIPTRERLVQVLRYMLDENEFLSPYGIRSLSRYHAANPYTFNADGQNLCVDYVPGESDSGLFGGNSNWRGPVWFPVNFLLIEALERYDRFYGDSLQVEFPTGSGNRMRLAQVARQIERRLVSLFLPGPDGRRPCHGDDAIYAADPCWRDLVLFYECFHGETGRGLGASHQTGWTALVAKWLMDREVT